MEISSSGNKNNKNINKRWLYLVVGTITLLFVGVIYAWSILKSPIADNFGWGVSEMALNYTLAMCFFCIGGVLGGILAKKNGVLITVICGGIICGLGFIFVSLLTGSSVVLLYLSYGIMGGLGIGIVYNTVIASVNAWFPDKKGLSSGIMLMAFGTSTLVIGKIADAMFINPDIGWRKTYMLLGIVMGLVIIIAGLIIRRPTDNDTLPQCKQKKRGNVNAEIQTMECSTMQMIRRPAFWMAFISIMLLACTGNSIISFAKDFVMTCGAEASMATFIVGIFSVCNGLGRIAFGILFDQMGCKKGMTISGIVTLCAAGICVISTMTGSLVVCVIGICMAGLSFSSCPICATNFVSVFYGMKNFATNFSVMNFNLILTSLIATVSNLIYMETGGYMTIFIFLLALGVIALIISFFIKRP